MVDALDADVAAGAPSFTAVFQSKEELRDKLMEIDEVPKDARLYFWNGKLWVRWEDSQDLPGPERDPLRIKVVRLPSAGTLLACKGSPRLYAVYIHSITHVLGRCSCRLSQQHFYASTISVI